MSKIQGIRILVKIITLFTKTAKNLGKDWRNGCLMLSINLYVKQRLSLLSALFQYNNTLLTIVTTKPGFTDSMYY